MRVVHVCRKPLSEGTVAKNTLKHGTGALNLGGSRIEFEDGLNMGAQQRQQASGGQTAVGGAFGAESLVGQVIPTYKPGGRWPANMVLQHLPGCQQVGSRTEPGVVINRWDDGMKPFGDGAGSPFTSSQGRSQEVPDWVCQPGCPVAELDKDTGNLPTQKSRARPQESNKKDDTLFGSWKGRSTEYLGGASRFFKQVGGSSE